jgi:transcriptional regulator with XRE-family HTH domain
MCYYAGMSKNTVPYLSRKLAELLAARGWTAYRLAAESGVDASTIGRLLSGERAHSVTLRTVAALAAALKVSVEIFLEKSSGNQ